jgi:hypothetical protein
MAEVQARIVTLMHDMTREAGSELRVEERRAVMVDLTFAYWAAKLHHEDAKLDRKRFQTIRSRLIEAGDNVHQLLFAVDGTLKDDNLMGRKGDSARKYDGVSTIFRDFEQVERLAALGAYRDGKAHPMALRHLEPILAPVAAHGGN